MTSATDIHLLERLRQRDQALFALSDVLDAKAGLAVVVITFLATQTSGWLTGAMPLPQPLWWFQIASSGCLAVSGFLAVASLWPRDHHADAAEEAVEWLQALRSHYPDEEAVERAFVTGTIERLSERIAANRQVADDKASFMFRVFAWAGLALGLNLCTAVGLAVLNARLS